ncbi:MAG: hypothetical protein OHK0038_15530 [Flammeovirgaceae bacterium]
MPKGTYKGQKDTKLVAINIPAINSKTMASVPEIIFIKYKPKITMATITLIALSMGPMFFFIRVCKLDSYELVYQF